MSLAVRLPVVLVELSFALGDFADRAGLLFPRLALLKGHVLYKRAFPFGAFSALLLDDLLCQ
jgi:hypothetical protein